MPPDPFTTLGPDRPVRPRPEFAAQLRLRIEAALATPPTDPPTTGSDPMPTETPTPTETSVATVLTPYLSVRDAAAAIDFYRRAFGAVETFRFDDTDGRIGHAELQIGGAALHLADEYPEAGHLGPLSIGGSPVLLALEVPDVDAVVARAVAEGATLVREVADQFYGDRSGQIVDPFGHRWSVTTRGEPLSLEEMQRRARDEQV
jgi:PhnB protein